MHSRLVIAVCMSAMGVSAPRPNFRAIGWGTAGGAMEPMGKLVPGAEGLERLVLGVAMQATGVAWCAALGLGVARQGLSSDQLLMSQLENWSDMGALVHGGRCAQFTISRWWKMVGRLPWQFWTSSGMLAGTRMGSRGAMICSINLTWGQY
jgi:hypothetical protein